MSRLDVFKAYLDRVDKNHYLTEREHKMYVKELTNMFEACLKNEDKLLKRIETLEEELESHRELTQFIVAME